jgi:hypothetical protein
MRTLIFAILLMSPFGFGQAQQTPPDIDGYVTSVTSTNDFAVDGNHVVCDAKTHYRTGNARAAVRFPGPMAHTWASRLRYLAKRTTRARH